MQKQTDDGQVMMDEEQGRGRDVGMWRSRRKGQRHSREGDRERNSLNP